uniref:ferric-chelate reductase (NADPH) n=1 Tax=Bionectria ochroleuca TaxID=29856 RepID=A0A8H7K1H2_BIOOC
MSHDHHEPQGIGSATNKAFAQDYWFIVAGVVGLGVAVRVVNHIEAKSRLKSCLDASTSKYPTIPRNRLSQFWATATAVVREIRHPQFYIPIRGLRWATPLPLGRILVLLAYWAVVAYMMGWNVVEDDVYYWERIGYRNGWVTVAQLPMLYLLAMKVNPIGLLIGSSHERLNWLHRWVARTMLITATVHGFHFWTMWARADFVEYALETTPLVKYGIGAWGILLWLFVTGILPLRRLAYEIWVAQHVIASIVMLWLVHVHIPDSARYLLWMSVSFLVFDRAARWALLGWRNIRLRPDKTSCQGQKGFGHHVSVQAVGETTTLVTVKNVHFAWNAGQHVYLWLPRVGLLEAHPYTIACAHQPTTGPDICTCNSVQLIVRAHGGFSKRLLAYAKAHPDSPNLTGFLSGPYGVPPLWEAYDTLVLVGASSGVSFTLPILESVVRMASSESKTVCVRKIEMVMVAKRGEEIEYYVDRARLAAREARQKGIEVVLHVAITGEGQVHQRRDLPTRDPSVDHSISEPVTDRSAGPAKAPCTEKCHGCCEAKEKAAEDAEGENTSDGSEERTYTSRPDIEKVIREPVESAWGETAVVVCGGKELTARTRNCVSRLSDERAVHKGTGAQGIYLHVEEYAF